MRGEAINDAVRAKYSRALSELHSPTWSSVAIFSFSCLEVAMLICGVDVPSAPKSPVDREKFAAPLAFIGVAGVGWSPEDRKGAFERISRLRKCRIEADISRISDTLLAGWVHKARSTTPINRRARKMSKLSPAHPSSLIPFPSMWSRYRPQARLFNCRGTVSERGNTIRLISHALVA